MDREPPRWVDWLMVGPLVVALEVVILVSPLEFLATLVPGKV